MRAFPSGTLAVGGGLVVYGITSYGFLVVSGRALGPERYAGLSVLWALTFLGAIGCFVPLEQVVARGMAARRAQGAGTEALVRQARSVGVVLLGGLLVVVLAASPVLLGSLFDHEVSLLASLCVALTGYFLVHLVRGVLSGAGRLLTYGVLLGVEGGVRLGACVVLALAEVEWVGAYAATLALAPFVALALTMRREGLSSPSDDTLPWRGLAGVLWHLLAGSLLSQALVNGPAVAVKVLASDQEQVVAGRFLAGLIVTRVPVFLFAAVQAALLPKLAALAAEGRLGEFRAELRRLTVAVSAFLAAGVVAAFLAGPPVVRAFFGSEFSLSRGVLTALAAGNAAFILAVVAAQALIALGRHRLVTLGWACGVAGFVAATFLPGQLVARVAAAFVVGSVVATVVLGAPLPGARRADGEGDSSLLLSGARA